AQCHNHPFDRWSQKHFWNMAAFYSGFARPDAPGADDVPMQMQRENRQARSIQIPGTDEIVPAVFLNGETPPIDTGISPREQLADWVVAPDNPYFSRMTVNRLWAQFFGRGLVHPVDDFSENNPPSHPEVLQLLADDLVAHQYDLRRIIRVITATRVYQLSGRQTHASQREPQDFARAALRGLTPEQFFDSLAEAVGYYQPYRSENPFVVAADSPRGRFLELFRDSAESSLDRETTILQALAMMNGDFVDQATSLDESQTLRAVAEFPGLSDADRVTTLFLAAVSRHPTADELERMTQYVAAGGATGGSKAALSDIFWALLNSSEFLLNH
ncbi:MAG: DUF1553 domain-containing protein, partial [Planctomycetaceae bacterium]|nr:DUF1553 domain-containing protein [Planctomycetaceae bacterium]